MPHLHVQACALKDLLRVNAILEFLQPLDLLVTCHDDLRGVRAVKAVHPADDACSMVYVNTWRAGYAAQPIRHEQTRQPTAEARHAAALPHACVEKTPMQPSSMQRAHVQPTGGGNPWLQCTCAHITKCTPCLTYSRSLHRSSSILLASLR